MIDGGSPLPRLRTLWRVHGLLVAIACGAGIGLVSVPIIDIGFDVRGIVPSLQWGLAVAFLCALALAPLLDWHARVAFRNQRWQRRPGEGVIVWRGAWWQREIWIPIKRLQHLDVVRGPLEQRLGLATLALFTAGTHHHRTIIPGLDPDEALRLRDALREEIEGMRTAIPSSPGNQM